MSNLTMQSMMEVRVEHYCGRRLSLTSVSLARKHGKRYLLACRCAEGGLLQGPSLFGLAHTYVTASWRSNWSIFN